MRKLTSIFLLTGAIFLLFGSIGVNVFFHSCEQDGTFVSLFSPDENHCTSDHLELKDCCANDQEKESKDGCCNDEIKNFKLKLDYFQDVNTNQHLQAEFQLYAVEVQESLSIPHLTIAKYANPPPQSRKKRIPQLQVWII